METRLAQVIAQSTGADGRIDRARLYEALRLSPEDPVSLIVEVALTAEEGQGSHAARMQTIMEQAHAKIAGIVDGQAKAYQTAQVSFDGRAAKLEEAARSLGQAAMSVGQAASAFGNRALLTAFLLGGIGGGLFCGSIVFFIKK